MRDKQYNEVLVALIACTLLFIVLAAIILLFLYLYQRRRFAQQQQLTAMQQEFKEQSLKAQLEIQERTFQAISQEIHDNVGQLLSLAKVQINILHETRRLDLALLAATRDNIGKAMTDLRDLSGSLNSERLRYRSIHDTVFLEAERINRTGTIVAQVEVEGETREMEPQKKLILCRILQESIQNCIKHADASCVSILCRYLPDEVYVSIRDNGKGFDLEAVLLQGSGQGLSNIKTRVQLTGGTHNIQSMLQEGTHIQITIPYE
jgi:two-component system NarL family sensor kinase